MRRDRKGAAKSHQNGTPNDREGPFGRCAQGAFECSGWPIARLADY